MNLLPLLFTVSMAFDVTLPPPNVVPTEAELQDKSFVELGLIRNQVYARRGRAFSTPWVNDYFSSKSWYKVNPNFAYSDVGPKEQEIVNAVAAVEVSRTPAQLRLRRNTVFARHGRVFKSPDLKKHFAAQPWYKANPDFKLSMLSERDQVEIALIQKFETQADAVRGLESWKPGRKVSAKLLEETPAFELANFLIRFVKGTRVKGLAPGDENQCEMASMMMAADDNDPEGDFCAVLRKGTVPAARLPKVDKATFKSLERAMAIAQVNSYHPEYVHCDDVCEAKDAACVKRCEQKQIDDDKAQELKMKRAVQKARKGQHEHGRKLVEGFLSAVASSMA